MANQQQNKDEVVKREMERKSLDDIRVANPTQEDYIVVWDRRDHLVPNVNHDAGFGKGQMVMKRYLAEKYCKEMCTKIINQRGESYVEEEKKKRAKAGLPELTPYEVSTMMWNKAPKTDNEKLIEEIYAQLFLGVEREYGIIHSFNPELQEVDARPIEERVLEKLDKPYMPPTQQKAENEPVQEPVIDKSAYMKNIKG